MCPEHRTFMPDNSAQRTHEDLYPPLYSKMYFALGQKQADGLGDVLPTLIAVAQASARQATG
jgi:hypothetical protein